MNTAATAWSWGTQQLAEHRAGQHIYDLAGLGGNGFEIGPDVHQVRPDPGTGQLPEPGDQGDQRDRDACREHHADDDPDSGLVPA